MGMDTGHCTVAEQSGEWERMGGRQKEGKTVSEGRMREEGENER